MNNVFCFLCKRIFLVPKNKKSESFVPFHFSQRRKQTVDEDEGENPGRETERRRSKSDEGGNSGSAPPRPLSLSLPPSLSLSLSRARALSSNSTKKTIYLSIYLYAYFSTSALSFSLLAPTSSSFFAPPTNTWNVGIALTSHVAATFSLASTSTLRKTMPVNSPESSSK